MNVSSVLASRYTAKTASAVGNLYSSVTTSGASAATPSANTSASPDAVVTLSSKALELMRVRQISDETTQQFKDILSRANASNAQADPKTFLSSLKYAYAHNMIPLEQYQHDMGFYDRLSKAMA